MPEALDRIADLVRRVDCPVQVDGGIKHDNARAVVRRRRPPARRRLGDLRLRGPDAHLQAARRSPAVTPLELALDLAERGRGTTHPNPVVGAVVERDGEVVGEGWHERKGEAHAEVHALRAAGERARGATLYVSLEPCSHHGATPPCTDAVIEAGIARVVIGARDPTPGRDGIARLACGRDRGRARRLVRGATAERGLAHLGLTRSAVRHLQGGDHARRSRRRAGVTLGDRRGVAPARPRAACRLRRGRRGHGHRPRRRPTARRARRPRPAPAAAARLRLRAAAPRLRARAALGIARDGAGRPRRRGRAVAPAGGRPDARDVVPRARASSTSCCSSSLRRSPAPGHAGRAISQSRFRCRASRPRRVGDDVLLEAYVHEPL